MSLLAGLSQQSDAINAHATAPDAHVHVATFSNADYVFAAGINIAQQIGTLTAARSVTLPAANSLPRGASIRVEDVSGSCSPALALTIAAAGSDTIGGKTNLVISTAYGAAELISDGVSLWLVEGSGVVLGSPVMGATRMLTIPGVEFWGVGAITPNVSRVLYSPFVVAQTAVVDQLAAEVTTPATDATKTAQIGIYTADINWQPGVLVTSAEVSTASAAVVTAAVSAVLPPGRYLTAITTSGASGSPAVRALRGGTGISGIDPAIGTAPFSARWEATRLYAALPATGPAWTAQFPSASGGIYPVVLRQVN